MSPIKLIFGRILPVVVLCVLLLVILQLAKRTDFLIDAENQEPPASGGNSGITAENDLSKEIDAFFSTLDSTDVLLSVGYGVSDKVYGEDMRLSLLSRELTPYKHYSLRTITEQEPVRVPHDKTYETQLVSVQTAVPSVMIYMDYLRIDHGDNVIICDNTGKKLYDKNASAAGLTPLYTRDSEGRPLFGRSEPSDENPEITVLKYYYLDDEGNQVASDYNDKRDNRGLEINYPSYFGKSDGRYSVDYSEDAGLYGFVDARGYSRGGYVYSKAYNFSEGVAATVDDKGVVTFRNNALRENHSSEPYTAEDGKAVIDIFLEPDTRGIESLGFFYFEDGLCRVRRQTVDAEQWNAGGKYTIYADEDILIKENGSEFATPAGYKVIAYSNGMILLEKDGFYGFMNSSGNWVIAPVYTYAKPFSEGLATVGRGGKVGLVDTDGGFVVPMIFDHIEVPSGGLIALYDFKNGWAVMNKCEAPAN